MAVSMLAAKGSAGLWGRKMGIALLFDSAAGRCDEHRCFNCDQLRTVAAALTHDEVTKLSSATRGETNINGDLERSYKIKHAKPRRSDSTHL